MSRPSSPRSPHSSTSTPSLGHAIEDEDLDELKEGLNYALGTKENEANWFPVNKLAKSSPTRGKRIQAMKILAL